MKSVEIREFCEDYSISIEKFLTENFSLESYVPKLNAKNKKWRIKHNEIAGWYNIVPVSLMFAHRYKHLVFTGKLVIVRDDFGRYCVYINPRIIQESQELESLQIRLQDVEDNFEVFEDTLKMLEIKRQLEDRIQDIEENLRIIRHFNGEDSLNYSSSIINEVGISRKRNVEKK